MKKEVRKVIESRDACDNLKRLTCKMNSFASTCEEYSTYNEPDEIITVPDTYSTRHLFHHGLTEAILNVLTLGLFSRVEAFTKHM